MKMKFIDLRDYSLSVYNSQKQLHAILWLMHRVQTEKAMKVDLCTHCMPVSMVDRLTKAKLIVFALLCRMHLGLNLGRY